jgi:2-succinyl-6-hydroxy-2,4-cyclohexadiene-1-carboxylate synthase
LPKSIPIVCLHGSTGNAHHWDEVASDLCSEYRVLCPDQRGHGDTGVPTDSFRVEDFAGDLISFVEALTLRNFVLIGHSLGSRVATFYGGTQPERLKAIILVDPSFDMSEKAQKDFIQGVVTQPEAYESRDQVFKVLRSRPTHVFRSDDAIWRQIILGMRTRSDGRLEWKYARRAAIGSLEHAREDIWPSAARVNVPTLILRGRASPVATTASVNRMLQTIKNSRVVVVEKAHHGIQQDNPEAFVSMVRPFLKQVLAQ